MNSRLLRITRIKKSYRSFLSEEENGIYLRIDGEFPELQTPISQNNIRPDGTVIERDPICRLSLIKNGESCMVKISEGEHTISANNYSNCAELRVSSLDEEVFCWLDSKGVHISTKKPVSPWIKRVVILIIVIYGIAFLIRVLNFFYL